MKLLMLMLAGLLTFSCAHKAHTVKEKTNILITKTLKGHSYGPIYFSGQPSAADFRALKKEGFVAVINLRRKKEKSYIESWERDYVKKQGMAYYNIPSTIKGDMDDAYLDSITSKIVKHKANGKVLVHCKSGNRVAVWIGGHFKKDHNYSSEDALSIAKKLGITKLAGETKLKKYLAK